MRFVFVMDPVDRVIVDEDTSYALMREAEARGHRVEHALATDLFVEGGVLHAHVRPAHCTDDRARPVDLGARERLAVESVDAVFIRKDPPFDDGYLWLTLLLEHVRGKTLLVNDPQGLRNANEKLYAMRFPEVAPRTLVSADKAEILGFVGEVGGEAVIKPIDGHGGEGVFKLEAGHMNQNALIETLTRHGTRLAMVQAFIPAVAKGDKRILLLDGEPLGAILRVPQKGDLRSNIHVGGRVEKSSLDAHDRRIVEAVADTLRREGLYFVGLDVIGGMLTEVNVTSPTGIQQMMRLDGVNHPGTVLDWVERRAASAHDAP
jgi:glutathione synthase